MDAGFDQDEAEFGILVFTVALEVLADGDGLRLCQNDFQGLQSTVAGGQDARVVLEADLHTFLINM